jgi:hypothetical protein
MSEVQYFRGGTVYASAETRGNRLRTLPGPRDALPSGALDSIQQCPVEKSSGSLADGSQLLDVLQQQSGIAVILGLQFLGFLPRTQGCLRLGNDQLSRLVVALHPGRVQLRDLPGGKAQALDIPGKSLSVFAVGARQRQEVPHRSMALQLPASHTLLQPSRQLRDQTDASTRPALGAAQPTSDIRQGRPVFLVQRPHQVGIFQREPLSWSLEIVHQHQRIDLAVVPDHGLDYVLADALGRTQTLVSIDDDVSARRFL